MGHVDLSLGHDDRQVPVGEAVRDVPPAAEINDVSADGTPALDWVPVNRFGPLGPSRPK
jgi:hypothetical protein